MSDQAIAFGGAGGNSLMNTCTCPRDNSGNRIGGHSQCPVHAMLGVVTTVGKQMTEVEKLLAHLKIIQCGFETLCTEYAALTAHAAKYEMALREIVAKFDGPDGDYEILDFLDIAERGLK
jgi:hypothetical protein